MIEFIVSTDDTPFMPKIFTSLQDYLWRERTSPKDFKDQENRENEREKLTYMTISIHRWGVAQQILNQSSRKW